MLEPLIFHVIPTLLTLLFIELIMGIDNLLFISLLVARLPKAQQAMARWYGIGLAILTRLILLATILWLTSFSQPLFATNNSLWSIRSIILMFGGGFIVLQSIKELFFYSSQSVTHANVKKFDSVLNVIVMIVIFDVFFSLDSVLTAVAMAKNVWLMVLAIVLSGIVMLYSSKIMSRLITNYPRIKIITLYFLLLVGVKLALSPFGLVISLSYLYSILVFAIVVEITAIYLV